MVTIEISNATPELQQQLELRAGTTLNAYLLPELQRVAAEPAVEDVLERIRSRGYVTLSESPAEIIRRARGT